MVCLFRTCELLMRDSVKQQHQHTIKTRINLDAQKKMAVIEPRHEKSDQARLKPACSPTETS